MSALRRHVGRVRRATRKAARKAHLKATPTSHSQPAKTRKAAGQVRRATKKAALSAQVKKIPGSSSRAGKMCKPVGQVGRAAKKAALKVQVKATPTSHSQPAKTRKAAGQVRRATKKRDLDGQVKETPASMAFERAFQLWAQNSPAGKMRRQVGRVRKATKEAAPDVQAKETPASSSQAGASSSPFLHKFVVEVQSQNTHLSMTCETASPHVGRARKATKKGNLDDQVKETASNSQAVKTADCDRPAEKSATPAEPAEETLVLEAPSEKTPDPDAQAEKIIERDCAAPIGTRTGGRVEQPVNLGRQAEEAPELQQKVEETVNLHGPGGEPVDVGQRPRKKLLLIEDDPTILMVLEMCLRTHEFDCVIAENGKVAQALLQVSRPDLIMVDLFMPVMDGLAFIKWLRQTARDSTPILVFSTVDDPKIIEEVLSSGADYFARKPLHPKELVKTLNKLAGSARRASMAASA